MEGYETERCQREYSLHQARSRFGFEEPMKEPVSLTIERLLSSAQVIGYGSVADTEPREPSDRLCSGAASQTHDCRGRALGLANSPHDRTDMNQERHCSRPRVGVGAVLSFSTEERSLASLVSAIYPSAEAQRGHLAPRQVGAGYRAPEPSQ
jgi:hypothetical protein